MTAARVWAGWPYKDPKESDLPCPGRVDMDDDRATPFPVLGEWERSIGSATVLVGAS